MSQREADHRNGRWGFVYLGLNHLSDSIADHNAALKIDPRQAASFFGRGIAKLRKGDAARGGGRHSGRAGGDRR